jgi:hypothetical protein
MKNSSITRIHDDNCEYDVLYAFSRECNLRELTSRDVAAPADG